MSYTFRLKFITKDNYRLGIQQHKHLVPWEGSVEIFLQSEQKDQLIKDATTLLLKGTGFPTFEDAQLAGDLARRKLTLALSKLKVAADFGDYHAQGGWFKAGLDLLGKLNQKKVLNNIHGLQVYETDPELVFANPLTADAYVTIAEKNCVPTIERAFSRTTPFDDKRNLAFSIFSMSAFSSFMGAKFILLVIAIETLIQPENRPHDQVHHINHLIQQTENAEITDKESILQLLKFMRKESIKSAGKRLTQNLNKSYMNLEGEKFFSKCYDLRSKLVHGQNPEDILEQARTLYPHLEQLVTDLICYPDF